MAWGTSFGQVMPVWPICIFRFFFANPGKAEVAAPMAAQVINVRRLTVFFIRETPRRQKTCSCRDSVAGAKEANDLHLFLPRIPQHVDFPLRKQDCAALLDGFDHALDHHLARSAHDVDDLLPVGMGVRGPDRLSRGHQDHAHRTMLCVDILPGHQPAKLPPGKIERLDGIFIHDG